jgi:curved DNA-binding protein CbpA
MENLLIAYRILGVGEQATIAEVTKAYRTLAKKYHPDSNPDQKDHAHSMMMKINNAYQTVKLHLSQESQTVSRESETHDLAQRIRKKVYSVVLERVRERQRREQEAFNRYMEARRKEREHEEQDQKSYNIIVKHSYLLIADFYEKGLHHRTVRDRPYQSILYEEFLGKYEILVQKCEKLTHSGKSKSYKKKFIVLSEFLLAFLEDLSNDDGMTVDRNASVQYGFRKAVEETDGFINFFFSNAKLMEEEATFELKGCLGDLENFVKSHPTSPLIDYADRKLEVLQKLYRAFIKA